MPFLQADLFRKIIICACILIALPAFSDALELPGLKLKYGTLKRSQDVTKTFEKPEILPNHTYYIYGWGSVPYAIIGISDQYKLRTGLWKEVEVTVPLLRGWIDKMDIIYDYPPYGSRILDHKGNQLGIWYSSKQWTTIIIEDDTQFAILAPEAPGFRGGH